MKYRIRWENKNFDDMGTLNCFKFIGVSSKHPQVFLESLWQSLDIVKNFWKFLENVQKHLSGLWNNFLKSSESGRKSSENHQKRCHQYGYIMKRTLHVRSKI